MQMAIEGNGTGACVMAEFIHFSERDKNILPPSQIVSRLTFFTTSLTTRLIQKIVQI